GCANAAGIVRSKTLSYFYKLRCESVASNLKITTNTVRVANGKVVVHVHYEWTPIRRGLTLLHEPLAYDNDNDVCTYVRLSRF
ncbi:unnamed protein product, partial [Ceratitis capitata]